jgi:hypothetical protein
LGDENPTNCITNDGKNSLTFLPEFPASCPYVTTVGATEQFEPEVAAWRPDGLDQMERTTATLPAEVASVITLNDLGIKTVLLMSTSRN